MKLQEFMNLPMQEALEKLTLSGTKVPTDDNGKVMTVELVYKSIPEPTKGEGKAQWR